MHYKLFGGRASTAQTRRSLQHFPRYPTCIKGWPPGRGRKGEGWCREELGGKGLKRRKVGRERMEEKRWGWEGDDGKE